MLVKDPSRNALRFSHVSAHRGRIQNLDMPIWHLKSCSLLLAVAACGTSGGGVDSVRAAPAKASAPAGITDADIRYSVSRLLGHEPSVLEPLVRAAARSHFEGVEPGWFDRFMELAGRGLPIFEGGGISMDAGAELRRHIEAIGSAHPARPEVQILVVMLGEDDPWRNAEQLRRLAQRFPDSARPWVWLTEIEWTPDDRLRAAVRCVALEPGNEQCRAAHADSRRAYQLPGCRARALQKEITFTGAAERKVPPFSQPLTVGDESLFSEPTASLTNRDIESVWLQTSSHGLPMLMVVFTPKGREKFREVTTRLVGERLAIAVAGEPFSAPVIQEAIPGGRAQLSLGYGADPREWIGTLCREAELRTLDDDMVLPTP